MNVGVVKKERANRKRFARSCAFQEWDAAHARKARKGRIKIWAEDEKKLGICRHM